MLVSMTGFGRGEGSDGMRRYVCEVRSVNHRFKDIGLKMPKDLYPLEERIRGLIDSRVSRGRIDVYISYEYVAPRPRRIQVDEGLASSYFDSIRSLATALGVPPDVSVSVLLSLPEVVRIEEQPEDLEKIWEGLEGVLGEAFDGLAHMRTVEGAKLQDDLLKRLDKIGQLVDGIELRAPGVVEDYRARLSQRVQELLGGVNVDPDRLAMEVAIFADRSDISEELVRLRSHLSQMRQAIMADDAPVGRKIEFLLQEIQREVNTIGSKANDAGIAGAVVEIKSEVEKVREQVQNVE